MTKEQLIAELEKNTAKKAKYEDIIDTMKGFIMFGIILVLWSVTFLSMDVNRVLWIVGVCISSVFTITCIGVALYSFGMLQVLKRQRTAIDFAMKDITIAELYERLEKEE